MDNEQKVKEYKDLIEKIYINTLKKATSKPQFNINKCSRYLKQL